MQPCCMRIDRLWQGMNNMKWWNAHKISHKHIQYIAIWIMQGNMKYAQHKQVWNEMKYDALHNYKRERDKETSGANANTKIYFEVRAPCSTSPPTPPCRISNPLTPTREPPPRRICYNPEYQTPLSTTPPMRQSNNHTSTEEAYKPHSTSTKEGAKTNHHINLYQKGIQQR